MIFCIFGCFSVFLLRKMWPEKNVKFSIRLSKVFYQVFIRISSNLLHGFIVSYSSLCGCLQADVFIICLYFLVFYHCFYLEKCGMGKALRSLIKSCLLWRSHQNLFKFDTWIHCIMHINMWVMTCWYILLFFAFICVFQYFYLKNFGLGMQLYSIITFISLVL